MGAQQPGQQGRAHMADVEDQAQPLGQTRVVDLAGDLRPGGGLGRPAGLERPGVQETGRGIVLFGQPDEGQGVRRRVQAVGIGLGRGDQGVLPSASKRQSPALTEPAGPGYGLVLAPPAAPCYIRRSRPSAERAGGEALPALYALALGV